MLGRWPARRRRHSSIVSTVIPLRSAVMAPPQGAVLLGDDERGDHAEHALGGLCVVDDVAVERPRPWFSGLDQHVDTLARRNQDSVLHVRLGERVAVLGDHLLWDA